MLCHMAQSKHHLRSAPPHHSPTLSSVRTVTARVADNSPASTESLVAWDIGGGHFVIRSVPIVATYLVHGDIVSCSERNGLLVVDDVVLSGGGTTIRLLVDDSGATEPSGLRERIAAQLVASGCAVERIGHHILAVGVGPDVDAGDIGTLCDAWIDAGVVKVVPTRK